MAVIGSPAVARPTGSLRLRPRARRSAAPAALLFLALAPALRAQPQPPANLEEIVVSGERRQRSAQDEAISITAFDQSELDRFGISDLSSLQAFVPSLHVGRFGSVALVTLRGMGLENVTPGGEPSVCLEQDGIPLCRSTAAVGLFYDLESLEVFRGPQGTAGGRSITGGKVVLNSQPPVPYPEASGDVQLGTQNQVLSRGTLNLPLAGEKLMARFTAVQESRDGYTQNLVTGRRQDQSDDASDLSLRGQLRSLPHPDLDLLLSGGHGHQGGVGFALTPLSRRSEIIQDCPDDDVQPPKVPICPARNLPPDGQVLFSDDPRRSAVNEVGSRDNDQAFVTARAGWTAPSLPLAGDTRLSAVAGWRRERSEETRDLDGFNANLSRQYQEQEAVQRSAEASWASAGGEAFEWKLGVFYLEEEVRVNLLSQEGVTGLERPFRVVTARTELTTSELAGYADLRVPIGEGAFGLLGVRRTRSAREGLEARGVSSSPLAPAPPRLRQPVDAVWHATTPRVGLELDFPFGSKLSSTLTWGFKTGGFTLGLGANGARQVFDPEETWTFEILAKNEWFDERLMLNTGFFWTKYDSYQSCFNQGAVFQCQTGKATSYGYELELRAEPVPGLSADATFDYLHARIDRLLTPDPTRGLSDPLAGVVYDLREEVLPRSPEVSLGCGLQYAFELGAWGSLTPRGQLRYQSRTYFEIFNREQYSQPATTWLDLRLGWTSRDEAFQIEAFADNLTDEDVISNIYIGGVFSEAPVFAAYLPPRTFGMRFGFRF